MAAESGNMAGTEGRRSRSWAQWFCLVGGAFLLVRGMIGVALDPAFEAPGEGWHQLIHLSSGAVLLAGSRQAGTALALTLGFGVVYAGVALAGILDGQDVAGVIPVQTSDNRIHTLLTIAALGAGLATLLRNRTPLRTAA
jgi:hypothetical protein